MVQWETMVIFGRTFALPDLLLAYYRMALPILIVGLLFRAIPKNGQIWIVSGRFQREVL
jgi:hypothetical protein